MYVLEHYDHRLPRLLIPQPALVARFNQFERIG
jgi:hypothetical protein